MRTIGASKSSVRILSHSIEQNRNDIRILIDRHAQKSTHLKPYSLFCLTAPTKLSQPKDSCPHRISHGNSSQGSTPCRLSAADHRTIAQGSASIKISDLVTSLRGCSNTFAHSVCKSLQKIPLTRSLAQRSFKFCMDAIVCHIVTHWS